MYESQQGSIGITDQQVLEHAITRASRDCEVQSALTDVLSVGQGLRLLASDELNLIQQGSELRTECLADYAWNWSNELGTGRATPEGKLLDLVAIEETLHRLSYAQAQEHLQLGRKLDELSSDLNTLSSDLYLAESRLASVTNLPDNITQFANFPGKLLDYRPMYDALEVVLNNVKDQPTSKTTEPPRLQDAFMLAYELSIIALLEVAFSASVLDTTDGEMSMEDLLDDAPIVRKSFDDLRSELRVILTYLFDRQFGSISDDMYLCQRVSEGLYIAKNLREATSLASKHNFLLAMGHALWSETSGIFDYLKSIIESKIEDWHWTTNKYSSLVNAPFEPSTTIKMGMQDIVQTTVCRSTLRHIDSILLDL